MPVRQVEHSSIAGPEPDVRAANALPTPAFIIIGAAKSATTTLFAHLRHHTQLHPSSIKEPMYFADNEIHHRGINWYRSLFDGALPAQLCFEASTAYTRWPQVPNVAERIAKHLPNVKLIYMMRHPVDRAYSHYVHRHTKELYPGEPIHFPFEQFIERDPMCIDSGMYMNQIEQYLRHFPRESMLLMLTEDFQRSREESLRRVCAFLDVEDQSSRMTNHVQERANQGSFHRYCRMRKELFDPLRRVPIIRALAPHLPMKVRDLGYELLRRTAFGERRVSKYEPMPMSAKTRAQLLAHFAKPNRELASFLGRDLKEWST